MMILNWPCSTYAKRSFTFQIFAWLGRISIWDNQKWLLQKTGCDHGVKIGSAQSIIHIVSYSQSDVEYHTDFISDV